MAASSTAAKRRYPPAYYRYREKHPSISVRLTKELKALLDAYRGGLSYGKAIKQLLQEKVDLLRLKKEVREGSYKEGFSDALQLFISNPHSFYEKVLEKEKGLEPALFTAPCSICGKPMVITHRDSNWASKIKPILLQAFKYWCHTSCKRP